MLFDTFFVDFSHALLELSDAKKESCSVQVALLNIVRLNPVVLRLKTTASFSFRLYLVTTLVIFFEYQCVAVQGHFHPLIAKFAG